MSKLLIVEEIKKLDPSWDETRQLFKHRIDYLIGIVEFKEQLISILEKEIEETSDIGDYSKGIKRGIEISLKNIKILKSK